MAHSLLKKAAPMAQSLLKLAPSIHRGVVHNLTGGVYAGSRAVAFARGDWPSALPRRSLCTDTDSFWGKIVFPVTKKKADPIFVKGVLRTEFGRDTREEATKNRKILATLQDSKGGRTYLVLEDKEIQKAYRRPGLYYTIFNLDVEGMEPTRCVVRHLQFHPVRDHILLHILLLKYEVGQEIWVDIPVKIANEEKCPAMKKGGMINTVIKKVRCLISGEEIPPSIVCDASNLDLGKTCVCSLSFSCSRLEVPVVDVLQLMGMAESGLRICHFRQASR